MKLFIWEPDTYGPYTVSVVAENLNQAQQAVDAFMAAEAQQDNLRYYHGWGTEHYQLKVHEPGTVVTHAND